MKILQSGAKDFETVFESLQNRRARIFDHFQRDVQSQIQGYRNHREKVLISNAETFDQCALKEDELWVNPGLIKSAHKGLSPAVRDAIEHVKERIETFQAELKTAAVQSQEESGVMWGTILRPLDRVGIYVPGGRAHYFLSLLFAGVPARMSGVKEIVVATPPKTKLGTPYVDPLFLYAAKLLDISTILVAGGPAALAALAFGTKKSAPVQKVLASGGARTIVGLHHLSGYVGVELCAGNSEICFICDDSTSIDMVAGDILGCADRDPEASVFLFHSSDKWIRGLVERLAALVADVKDLQSRETIQRCLEKNFFCFICKDLSEAFELSNRLGPGTLSVQVENASEHLEKIEVAGQVLLGSYSPPTATDLIGGAAGLVSTWGSAAFSSSLSPAAFMRRFPYVEVSKEALERTHAESRKLAEEEGFHEREPSFVARIGN